MKRGKLMILVLTVLFAAVAVVFGRNELSMENFPFSVVVTSDGAQEELRCMKLGNEYYMFLPSYAEGGKGKIRTNLVYDVSVNGQQLTNGQSCEDFPANTQLQMYFRSGGNEGYETITFVRSANVATMYIDVPSGSMEYIHEKKGNAEAASIRLYTEDGTLDYSGSAESVRGRGNATWTDDKKPYSLTLIQEADLLGMGKASKWILLANAFDYSHLRNKLSFDFAKAVDLPYSPDCTWTDLYLNGEYAGLYLLSERNEVHPHRVDIDPKSSFLVCIDPGWRLQEQNYPYVATDSGLALRIHHNTMQMDAVRQIWQSAENAILAADGLDPVTGKSWDEIIDVDSWARKYLIEEIFANEDSGLASEFFFYEEADGKIYAGPIWDMDITLKKGDVLSISAGAILAGRPHLRSETDTPLFYALLQKPEFYNRMVQLYQTEFHPQLIQLLDSGVEQYARKTAQAALANQIRWSVKDSRTNIDEMCTFLEERIQFLDDYWINKENYCLVEMQSGSIWAFAVPTGEVVDYLPIIQGQEWYMADTDTPFDRTAPVDRDIVIYTKEIVSELE